MFLCCAHCIAKAVLIFQLNLILDCLQAFLSRFVSDLQQYKKLGNAVVKRLLLSTPSISYQLSIKNKSSHMKVALKLLTAMVRHGGWAASAVLEAKELNLDQLNMKQLLNCKDLKVSIYNYTYHFKSLQLLVECGSVEV